MMTWVSGVWLAASQLSLLPLRHGRHSYSVVVGLALYLAYRSASPVPPLMLISRLVAPDGTSILKNCSELALPDRLVFGTPLVNSTVSPPSPPSPPSSPLPSSSEYRRRLGEPVPTPLILPVVAADKTAFSTWAGEALGLLDRYRAATPAT